MKTRNLACPSKMIVLLDALYDKGAGGALACTNVQEWFSMHMRLILSVHLRVGRIMAEKLGSTVLIEADPSTLY